MPELMNTREVARYLGVNEKKVYFLAKSGKIPCTRVTGKWTFPKKLIDQWIEESASGLVARKASAEERVFLLAAGSDDPSLGILHDLYEAQTQPASFFMTTVGSTGGLAAIRSGVADFATAHLLEPPRANSNETAFRLVPADAVIIELFYRELGLLVPPGNPKGIKSIRDLARPKLRIINRQARLGNADLSRSGACARAVERQKNLRLRHGSFNAPRGGLEGSWGRCRCWPGNSDNGAIARARFYLSYPRAFRRRDTQRAFLLARHPGLTWNPGLS